MIDTRGIKAHTMSKKYMWQLAVENSQCNNAAYFYAPYVPLMKEGIVRYDAV